jgi:putative phosphoribosyl transferase
MPRVHVHQIVMRPSPMFRDRRDAGRRLADFMGLASKPESLVFGLPRGGIPTGEPIAHALDAELEPVFIRKLPIPYSPEMGFGAVTIDGTYTLNKEVVKVFGISDAQIEEIKADVIAELRRSAKEYSGGAELPPILGKDVYLVDDGLATGYTMMAAAKMVKKYSPKSITVCAPVSPEDSLAKVEPYADEIYCLVAQKFPPFAVASFYRDFHDLSDSEVKEILGRTRAARTH